MHFSILVHLTIGCENEMKLWWLLAVKCDPSVGKSSPCPHLSPDAVFRQDLDLTSGPQRHHPRIVTVPEAFIHQVKIRIRSSSLDKIYWNLGYSLSCKLVGHSGLSLVNDKQHINSQDDINPLSKPLIVDWDWIPVIFHIEDSATQH